ncbi:MAG: FAD-dependent monooxygenase [Deltaproteobacteria bacterium]|nr:FAD-dependent monooxygenase [Deltaproteobacteria bacterium]
MRRIQVAVVGAGTAGAAAGTLLARAGHEVTVFERVEEPGPIGAGITIQPTGQAALARLGLLAEVAARGAELDRLVCRRRDGRAIVDLRYAEIDPGLRGLGTHRGNLFLTLHAALRTSGAVVRCGVDIAGSEVDAHGRWLASAGGERLGPFDLVVAADGSVCELHGAARWVRSSPYPWGALWLVADDPGFAADRCIYQIVDGAHTMLGFLPTGLSPGRDVPVVSLFWSIRADRVDAWRAAGLPAWRDRVLALEPRAEPILDGVRDLDGILFAKYRDVAMYPWHADRIVFLGDAAHAMSPQLGQGANLALIDAVALADAIDGCESVGDALAAYTRARRRHLAYYQFATRALTPYFQSDSRLRAWVRDRFFPASRWLGPLRCRMTRTMIGVDRGIVRRPMSLEGLPRVPWPALADVRRGAA